MHWWVADWWNSPSGHGPIIVISWIVWVIGSIVLHELAHGWAALAKGDPTPRATGHMTWNPLVHMGQMSLIAFLLIGIAWGAMPIDPSRMRGRWAPLIVTAAGPAMNLALALAAIFGAVLWLGLAGGVPEPLRTNGHIFLTIGAVLNLVLMLFNLLPIPPLDGGRIAEELIPAYRRLLQSTNGQWVALGAFLLIFFLGGRYLFTAGFLAAGWPIHVLGGLLGDATGRGIPADAVPF